MQLEGSALRCPQCGAAFDVAQPDFWSFARFLLIFFAHVGLAFSVLFAGCLMLR
jgi:hypothetical protein